MKSPDVIVTELVNEKLIEEVPEAAVSDLGSVSGLITDQMAVSVAISAKRQADALERIANAFDQHSGVGNVLHWLETIASALNSGVGR